MTSSGRVAWNSTLALTISMALLAGITACIIPVSKQVPGGFLPAEYQGFLIGGVILKPGVSLQRLTEQVKPVEKVLLEEPTTDFAVSIIGMNLVIGVQTTNALSFFACLKPYAERPVMENGEIPTADDVQKRVQAKLAMCGVDGVSFLVSPPAIPGVGVGSDIALALEEAPEGAHDADQQHTGTQTADGSPGIGLVLEGSQLAAEQGHEGGAGDAKS